jgi:hypothetical protein
MSYSEESDDTVGLPQGAMEDDGNSKKCCNCGKDLRGHRRFKDSIGYWCKDCHRVDLKRNTAAEARCPDCGRMRPLDKLFMVDGRNICSACRKEVLAQAEKAAVTAQIEKEVESAERRKLYMMFGVLIVLGALLLWHLLSPYFHR